MNNETRSNILREGLKKDENLFKEFNFIEQSAYKDWVQLFGHDKGSHSGTPHLIGVENLICSVLEKVDGVELSPAENFILLSSILFHDLGKIINEDKIKKLLKNKENKHNIFVIAKKEQSEVNKRKKKKTKPETIHHALVSAMELLSDNDFGFRDKSIIECIAVVCASHRRKVAEELKNKNELKNRFLDNYGKIRIGWLCALLTLGDELDNSYHRSAPGWAKSDEQTTKKDLRDKLSGCEIDFEGKVLLVHLQSEFYELLINKKKSAKTSQIINWIYDDLKNKRDILQLWHEEFRQMHINLVDVVLNVKGHLLGIKINKDDIEKDSLEGCFQLVVEPIIRQMKFERVLDAALVLRFNSFGKTTYPWETLATEAGIEEISETKKIFHRLSMLSIIFNDRSVNTLHYIVKNTGPKTNKKKKSISFSFVELDGEWTINISNRLKVRTSSSSNSAEGPKDNDINKIFQEFVNWVSKIISSEKISTRNQHKRDILNIKNEELTYLLDEKNLYGGIYFPESKSNLFPKDTHRTGINLLIVGPAGVGKSTLAMELLAKGTVDSSGDKDARVMINAYYALEQQYSSLLEIANGLGVDINNQIKSFRPILDSPEIENIRKPDYFGIYRESIKNYKDTERPIIYFPRLAPRSYGRESTDDYLFWFRFKQIASLLEAARYDMLRSAMDRKASLLNAIVIDNLNAFSRNPLARQQVHQLFKLISWSGQLGIYIIENNPSEEETIFQGEVEFLADIVIRLDWVLGDYQYKTIEIAKSRCQRNVIGKHPFKIKRNIKNNKKDRLLKLGTKADPRFEIYPSIHTQVSKSEKSQQSQEFNNSEQFSKNRALKDMVQKNLKGDTGINKDAFIMLLGKSGGHKLAIGMNYIHAKKANESALVINLGQPIKYDAVADYKGWWNGNYSKKQLNLKWNKNQKVSVDLYHPNIDSDPKKTEIEPCRGSVFILNFHAGFLLPEEFLQIVKTLINDIDSDKKRRIGRVLLNSTAHLPERFPLLDKNPLLLHALAKVLKQLEKGFMIIGVEDMGQDEKLKGLVSIADLKVTIHHAQDERLPQKYREALTDKITESKSNLRIISSDNVTGKDYSKKYKFFEVLTDGDPVFKISNIPIKNKRSKAKKSKP